jgi:ribosome modulation factor
MIESTEPIIRESLGRPQLGAFQRGQRAAQAGLLKGDCPYISKKGRFRACWMAGYEFQKAVDGAKNAGGAS